MAGVPGASMQSIWLPVPEMDGLLDGFRREGDWSHGLGIPAHITLAGPWPLAAELPREALAEVADAARGTEFRLASVGMLGGAVCLLVEDELPLRELRWRLLAAADQGDALESAWRPHVTVCRDASEATLEAVREAVDPALPLDCAVGDLRLGRLQVERGGAARDRVCFNVEPVCRR
jgi:2'-5' RNA ligase